MSKFPLYPAPQDVDLFTLLKLDEGQLAAIIGANKPSPQQQLNTTATLQYTNTTTPATVAVNAPRGFLPHIAEKVSPFWFIEGADAPFSALPKYAANDRELKAIAEDVVTYLKSTQSRLALRGSGINESAIGRLQEQVLRDIVGIKKHENATLKERFARIIKGSSFEFYLQALNPTLVKAISKDGKAVSYDFDGEGGYKYEAKYSDQHMILQAEANRMAKSRGQLRLPEEAMTTIRMGTSWVTVANTSYWPNDNSLAAWQKAEVAKKIAVEQMHATYLPWFQGHYAIKGCYNYDMERFQIYGIWDRAQYATGQVWFTYFKHASGREFGREIVAYSDTRLTTTKGLPIEMSADRERLHIMSPDAYKGYVPQVAPGQNDKLETYLLGLKD